MRRFVIRRDFDAEAHVTVAASANCQMTGRKTDPDLTRIAGAAFCARYAEHRRVAANDRDVAGTKVHRDFAARRDGSLERAGAGTGLTGQGGRYRDRDDDEEGRNSHSRLNYE
jgi:hypothetical protein